MIRGKSVLFLLACIFAAACIVTGSPTAYAGKDKCRVQKEQKRAKAKYYYLEGIRHQVEGRSAEAYENFRHAYNTDPDFEEASYLYGQHRLVANVDTLASEEELKKSIGMMKKYVDAYPEDYEEGLYYAYVAGHVDSVQEAIRVYQRIDTLFPERTSTLILLSDAYFSAYEDEKGFATLDRYEKAEGKSPNISLKKISYLINRRDTIGAIAEATSLVASNPREPAYLLLKGNLLNLTGRTDSVEIYLKKAEELAPDFGAAKLALADLFLSRGDSAAYDAKIYEALLSEDYDLEDKTALLSEYLQKLLYANSDTKRGDYLFSVVEKQYPFEPSVIDLAARYSAAKGDFSKAVERIDYALNMDMSNETYWGQKMSYLISDDRWKEAISTYEEAIKHVDPGLGLRTLCASAAQIGEDYPLAIKMYGELIQQLAPRLKPDQPLKTNEIPSNLSLEELEQLSGLYTTIGDCYYNSGNKEKAFEAYENALRIDPENSMALNNYAYFTVESGGDIEKAEDMSRRSLRGENEDNPTFLDTYAWILYKLGKYDEAIETQKRAIQLMEERKVDNEEFWSHYGDMLNASGDRQGALEAWQKALDLADDKTEIIKKINENK